MTYCVTVLLIVTLLLVTINISINIHIVINIKETNKYNSRTQRVFLTNSFMLLLHRQAIIRLENIKMQCATNI